MKHAALLLSLLVTTLGTGTSAAAAGIDLNWDNCLYSAADAHQNKTFNCDDSASGAGDADTQVFRLYGSLRTGYDIPGVIAWGANIQLLIETQNLESWWSLAAGECREGSITFQYRSFTNATSCVKNLMTTSPEPLFVANWTSGNAGGYQAHYFFGVARTTGVTVSGASKYQLFVINLDSRFTKLDPANPDQGGHECSGCAATACILLEQVEVDVPAIQQPPDGKNIVNNPDLNNWVTWQGAPFVGNCYVSTERPTWGKLKSLYR